MRYWRAIVLTPVLALVGGCSTPVTFVTASGEVLKGGASSRPIVGGAFYATNGKTSCDGPFRASVLDGEISVVATYSDLRRGNGIIPPSGWG
jgi:hypothetical protein